MEATFPFITDENTIKHLRKSKIMFILRGLPGSGKSTIVSDILRKYRDASVCSADNFFLSSDGRYHFDTDKLSEAHETCHDATKAACESGKNIVIIDNTNIKRWELRFYVGIAAKHNYTVILVMPQTWWRFDAAELAKRNKHNVPESVLLTKLGKFETVLPFYWGWFLNEADSCSMINLAQKYFGLCIENLQQFCRHVKGRNQVDEGVSNLTFNQLYSRRGASTNNVHCTAFFAGSGGNKQTPESIMYSKRQAVQKSMGQVLGLHVIGLCITPRTVGARIALTRDQMLMWGKEDECDVEATSKTPGSISTIEKLTKGIQQTHIDDKHVVAVEGLHEKLNNSPKFAPTSGRGSRAHLTLGWSSDSKAVQTGFDLMQIIAKEQSDMSVGLNVPVEDATILYYGDGECVVYFDTPLIVNTLFTGKY